MFMQKIIINKQLNINASRKLDEILPEVKKMYTRDEHNRLNNHI